ncbi:MAG TPA: GntR family transcriptional regulator [Pseudolabrys sp.]|nr:GntR family transcriptional regulator [Pseudolabrys sp.]
MLHEEVVGRLRTILLDGEIPPGGRIPERELCAKLAISRTPLREALKVLAAEGLVLLLPNRGSRAAKLTGKDLQDLFEVCQGLEALAGDLACERITDAEFAAIRTFHDEMVDHYRRGELAPYYRCNRHIHEAIINAARNPVLTGLYESVTARIRRARYVTPMPPPNWAVAVQEHEAILNALLRRDGTALSHILRTHLRHKKEEVIRAGFAEIEQQRPMEGRHGLFGGSVQAGYGSRADI